MINMYSRKLLLPFVGVIQLAEVGKARALSLDGKDWAIHYVIPSHAKPQSRTQISDLDAEYTLVAVFQGGQLKAKTAYRHLQDANAHAHIDLLCEAVSTTHIPLSATDRFEYWLLDKNDGEPLALLQTATRQEEMARPVPQAEWRAMPASQLEILTQEVSSEADQNIYVPPVNYRLEKLIEERAGDKPRAVWLERSNPAKDNFPPCLIREDWDTETAKQLCDQYIERLAPRLLMLHGLPQAVRQRLERSACQFVFDVEKFYPLYPEVIDKAMMDRARVEAQIRHSN